jgi:hypothetical protein
MKIKVAIEIAMISHDARGKRAISAPMQTHQITPSASETAGSASTVSPPVTHAANSIPKAGIAVATSHNLRRR